MDIEENELKDDNRQDKNKEEIVWENIWSPESPFYPHNNPPQKPEVDYIPKDLSFLEKLAIWTRNYTIEPMDLKVLRANGSRAIPELSGIEEFDKYQEIRSIFSDYLSRFNKEAREIWEMVKQEHPELFVEANKEKEDEVSEIEIDGEER